LDYIPKNDKLVKNKGIEIPHIPNDPIGLAIGLRPTHDILGNKVQGKSDLGAIELYMLTNGEIKTGKELYQDVLYVYQDRSDIIWVGTNGGGLCKIDESINQFGGKQHAGLTSSLPKEPLWSVMKDQQGVLWVGTKGNKDLYYSKDGKQFSKLALPDFQTLNFSMKAGVRTLLESQDGTIWVGTNFSLVKFLKTGDGFEPEIVRIKEEGTPNPVRLRQTSALYQTSDGTFWIGTQQNGLRDPFRQACREKKSLGFTGRVKKKEDLKVTG
jgi:hypothetical protein